MPASPTPTTDVDPGPAQQGGTSTTPNSSLVSRRSFLAASGVGLAGIVTTATTGMGTRLALGAPGTPQTGDALVVVFLRGGADGLSLAPPYGMASYQNLRPTIAVPPPGSANGALPLTSANPNASFPTGLDGVVGLHPALRPIHDTLWQQGRLAVIPATGLPPSESPSRSHFSATRYVQAGSASSSVGGGWLARMVNVQAGTGIVPAVDTSGGAQLLRGGQGVVSIPRLSTFGVSGFPNRAASIAALRMLHGGTDSISARGRTVLDVVDRIESLGDGLRPGFPTHRLGRTFSELSTLLGAGLGIQAAVINSGGWDHHVNHGPVGQGRFHDRTTELAQSLRAFADDTNGLDEITVLVMTEFGRTINENGNQGTDHGRAATHLIMGAGIRGGVFGDDFPSQIQDDPRHGDLPVLTDYRKPVAEIVEQRAGVGALDVVFPTYQRQGVLGLTR